MIKSVSTAEIRESVGRLEAGDMVSLSGVIYTARDAAHKKIFDILDSGGRLPFDLAGAVIYYAGPTPGRRGMAVGACGPTTSGRMDKFTPRMLDLGLAAMIGKGERSEEVCRSIKKNGCVYFCAVGGAGALIAGCIKSAQEVAFSELGCESVKKLEIADLPVIVAVDSKGGDLFKAGPRRWRSAAPRAGRLCVRNDL